VKLVCVMSTDGRGIQKMQEQFFCVKFSGVFSCFQPLKSNKTQGISTNSVEFALYQ